MNEILWKEIRESATTIIALASAIPLSIQAWKTLNEYKVKAKIEALNATKLQAEIDIQLLKQFTDLLDIAHGRGKSELSNSAVEKILTEKVIADIERKDAGYDDIKEIKDKINLISIFIFPVGAVAQDSAIASIYTLGSKHEILKIPAIEALKGLSKFRPIAQEYLDKLN